MNATTNLAGEAIRFTDLEPLICDADNMVDVLMDMCETHFSKSGEDDIIVTSTEAARLFFIACQAVTMSHKMKKAFYEARDNERAEGGLRIVGELGALFAAHVGALAAYDATPGENPKSPAVVRANALVTKTRQALFDHRPANMAEAARKGEFMASCRTFIEWDDFDQAQLIKALAPAGAK
ncbi:hypothetical protein MesoLj131c_63710 [Mesorhizobium sp. 131-3-5]|uniref:hypothetical protein n=1 Tax=Mesorhizobium sp. 131-3-5 TaxID=2744520 RepID=UPI0019280B0A|nr:hypothetical protein [Mesorhizobium sp. 131-3-5]BCH12113.1 hypothetical protein MesoLj131c_63710 [Mesorhizobium sp. 131-3-5]